MNAPSLMDDPLRAWERFEPSEREPARRTDVFTARPDALWSQVLRRKGSEYVLLATMPMDPSLN